jgi:transaldolase
MATKAPTRLRSPLHEMVETTSTDFWNDSSSVEELTYAIEHGAVGATSNPTIVSEVLAKEMPFWRPRIEELIAANPTWGEDELTWTLFGEIAVRGAELLRPIYERERGLKGRLSIQTDPRLYRNTAALVEQGQRFSRLAPNMQVKVPATRAGIAAVEELTALGININATVSFSVPQVVAVAEAVERGLRRRRASGEDVATIKPVATMMVGRLDDWVQAIAARDDLLLTPGVASWAGIACFKQAYPIFLERGYTTRLLAAAYRHRLHWTELIGGDIVLTIPAKWQRLFNASTFPVSPRIDEPVPAEIVDELYREVPDFRRAYEVDGLALDEFDTFGATVRTLRTFIDSYHSLAGTIRSFMLPDPDVRR